MSFRINLLRTSATPSIFYAEAILNFSSPSGVEYMAVPNKACVKRGVSERLLHSTVIRGPGRVFLRGVE